MGGLLAPRQNNNLLRASRADSPEADVQASTGKPVRQVVESNGAGSGAQVLARCCCLAFACVNWSDRGLPSPFTIRYQFPERLGRLLAGCTGREITVRPGGIPQGLCFPAADCVCLDCGRVRPMPLPAPHVAQLAI